MIALVLTVLLSGDALWTRIQPVRTQGAGIVGDVASQVPSNYTLDSVHENTHFVNSRLRQVLGGDWSAFYCGGGWALCVHQPKGVTMARVANAVPANLRGGGYSLYLVQQRQYWDSEPAYILDEWSAYLNGLQAAIEARQSDVGFQLEKATEFQHYAFVLVSVHVPSDEFLAAVQWQSDRLYRIAEQARYELGLSAAVESVRPFAWQLRRDASAAPIRSAIRKHFGQRWAAESLFLPEEGRQ